MNRRGEIDRNGEKNLSMTSGKVVNISDMVLTTLGISLHLISKAIL